MRGELAVHNGDPAAGVVALQSALSTLHENRYELLTTAFLCAIGLGQARLGQVGTALSTIDDAIAHVQENGDRFLLPELLRIRGELLAVRARPDTTEAESCLRRAISIARQHGAVSWELRTAISLLHLLTDRDGRAEALVLLSDLVNRMAGRADTADFRTARHLLTAG